MRLTRSPCFFAFLSILLAIVLLPRIAYVDRHGLWADEGIRYQIISGNPYILQASYKLHVAPLRFDPDIARQRFGSGPVLEQVSNYPYFPLYFTLMNAATGLNANATPLFIKVWNLLFALVTASVLFFVMTAFLPVWPSAFGVILFAFSMFDIGVTLQIKSYGLATMLSVSSTAILINILQQSNASPKKFFLYGTCVSAGMVTHAVFLYLLPLHGACLLFSRIDKPLLKRWVVTLSISSIPLLIWFWYAGPKQFALLKALQKQPYEHYSGVSRLPQKIYDLLSHNIFPAATESHEPLSIIVFLSLVFLCAIPIKSIFRPPKRLRDIAYSVCFICFWGSVLIFSALYVTTRQEQPLWPRYLTMYLPFFWVCVVIGTETLIAKRSRRLQTGRRSIFGVPPAKLLRSLIVLAFGVVLIRQFNLFSNKCAIDSITDWRPVTQALSGKISNQDLVVHIPGYGAFVAFATYWKGREVHTQMATFGRDDLDRIRRLGAGKPIWFIVREDFAANRESIESYFTKFGYKNKEVIRRPRFLGFSLAKTPLQGAPKQPL